MKINIILFILMPSRVFSKEHSNSCSDIINKKKYTEFKKSVHQKNNISTPYNSYINGLKQSVISCELNNICNNSPINIEQAKTSYIYNNNTKNNDCNVQNILYPYGLYLCDNKPNNLVLINILNNVKKVKKTCTNALSTTCYKTATATCSTCCKKATTTCSTGTNTSTSTCSTGTNTTTTTCSTGTNTTTTNSTSCSTCALKSTILYYHYEVMNSDIIVKINLLLLEYISLGDKLLDKTIMTLDDFNDLNMELTKLLHISTTCKDTTVESYIHSIIENYTNILRCIYYAFREKQNYNDLTTISKRWAKDSTILNNINLLKKYIQELNYNAKLFDINVEAPLMIIRPEYLKYNELYGYPKNGEYDPDLLLQIINGNNGISNSSSSCDSSSSSSCDSSSSSSDSDDYDAVDCDNE